MKFFISMIVTALLAFACGLYMPWWTIAVAAFIVAVFIYQAPGWSFLSGFLGIFLLWALLAVFINSSNNSILAPKIAHILPFSGSVFTLILVTALVGGITGGLSALTGSLLKFHSWAHYTTGFPKRN